MAERFYITTPIYYVNDRPHIGHVYTTTVADIVARYHRLIGDEVFFLTGTDEHAAKVVDAAAERGLTAQQCADKNARAFEETFVRLGMSNDDFIRTTQERHKIRVQRYVKQLLESGDVYLGDYEGWYDPGQEEYVPESKAHEYGFKSPINGQPLVRKSEKNYFFRLRKYRESLLDHLDTHPDFVKPDARRNEIIARIREAEDVPISRTGVGDWGIKVPGDNAHTIYVWIDALFNYLTTVDTEEHRQFWPANVHLIAKDILWFHAAIWPGMLMALQKQPGFSWVDLPRQIYSHSFWISKGQKMSKSLGNFIDLERIDHYVTTFGLDALRYYLATAGPLGSTDSNFAEPKFIEVYNSDLANTLGNCTSRVANMIGRYFDGKLPGNGTNSSIVRNGISRVETITKTATGEIPTGSSYRDYLRVLDLNGLCENALSIIRAVDRCIDQTEPFRLAKDKATLPQAGVVLYNCAEALRIASLLLWPILPRKMEQLWQQFGRSEYAHALTNRGEGRLDEWTRWGQLQPGTPLPKGEALFPRYQS